MSEDRMNLPPGFRFNPTDEELVFHFLYRKVANIPCHPNTIPNLDLCRFDPWDLNGKALEGEKKWYFFSHRVQDRVSPTGYWKVIGSDDHITSADRTVGVKKSLCFYVGEAPKGIKSNWVMHEFHLLDRGTSSRPSRRRGKSKIVSDEWILCRVQERNCGSQTSSCNDGSELSCLDEIFLSLDDLDEISWPN